jgi:hypothetical protein
MNNPALTWRVRRVGQKLWTCVCASDPMSWLSGATMRSESAAPHDHVTSLRKSESDRHWLAALRLPPPIAAADGERTESMST